MGKLKKLLNDEVLFMSIDETETENEKLLIMLALIRDNLVLIRDNTKSIKSWVLLIGVLWIIGSCIGSIALFFCWWSC